MKTNVSQSAFSKSGYALLIVLGLAAVCLIIFGASLRRTTTTASFNDRNNQYVVNLNAAEAAVEKAVAQMAYDFQVNGMPALAQGINSGKYATNYPNEDPYWTNFEFSDGAGNVNRTYVRSNYTYSGPLPSQYEGLTCINSPVYRVMSNVRQINSRNSNLKAAVQVDVLAALVPITQYAVFYQGLLEFTYTAPLTINGRVHANGNIYQGSTGGYTFNGTVTTTGTITAPANDGHNSSWPQKGTYKGSPTNSVGLATINLSIGTNMSSAHQLIEVPPAAYAGVNATGILAQSYLYNKAQVVLTVSNSLVKLSVQEAPSSGQVASQDPSPTIMVFTNLAAISAATNLPFLTLTNRFYDQREKKTNYVVDIDIGRYAQWSATNSWVQGKTTKPTILYVANSRTNFNSTQIPGVRLNNGRNLPTNEGLGFTVATFNPLYIWGHYNQTNNSFLNTTNTTSGTVPAALMSDALTILSGNWTDQNSFTYLTTPANRNAANTTVNAAIITGVMPSTGATTSTFSGGVHNLPRLLEDWLNVSGGQRSLYLNTSIAKLFSSTIATNQFRNPVNFGLSDSPYYDPPQRKFSYDLNFQDYAKQPPGIPTALVLIRKDWANPPPDTTDYYAAP
jgi:hypothetical protein